MIEFIIGLVAVLVLVSVLIQFCGFEWDGRRIPGLLSAQTETMVEARKEAGERAVAELQIMQSADYIRDWSEGRDERRHTPDDEFDEGDGIMFGNTVVNKAVNDDSQWSLFERPNDITIMRDLSGNPSGVFGLVRGSDSVNIELMRAIQQLVHGSESIEMESEVWMTWTKGIY